MSLLNRIKPRFWDHLDSGSQGLGRSLFNFRRIWIHAVLWSSLVATLPLVTLALIDYRVTQRSIESEILLRAGRLVSNTRRTISFFLMERKAALDFIIRHHSRRDIRSKDRLAGILADLRRSFGGFADMGVIDASGRQETYVGPYNLVGKDYSQQAWFREVRERGFYISDVIKGFRNVPHMVIAVAADRESADFYVLRATLDFHQFNELLSHMELDGRGDAFIINHEGMLQTPSRYHGSVLDRVSLAVPPYNDRSIVLEGADTGGVPLIIGYAYIDESPFVLMIVKRKHDLMAPWEVTRRELIGFLGISLVLILVVILSVGTYLVNRIFIADQRRVMGLHAVEYASKMASIGRLAAGVAHEVNNPLAIINEKAGLMRDLLLPMPDLPVQPRLTKLADDVIASVERCAAITHRLLDFARHVDVTVQPVNLAAIVREVLGFLGKEADYRGIEVRISAPEDLPPVESDRGKLQQIFLNLFNNAFDAMADGGKLDIEMTRGNSAIEIRIRDTGCGISASDLKRIFEPFFSTKIRQGGTGLGLSITYGLIQEIGGSISVASREGQGATFVLTLPLEAKGKNHASHTCTVGG
jgi:two-component system, NtrC family, sensor kinase